MTLKVVTSPSLAVAGKAAQASGMGHAVHSFDTPVGRYYLREEDGAIVSGGWRVEEAVSPTPLLSEAERQVMAYWRGEIEAFDLPLRVEGGDLVRAVCEELSVIPFGETRTYGDLAKTLGRPAQAIGQACGQNPIALIIPCHRVLSANGLGGFSAPGGVETKVALLRHEGAAGLMI